MASSPVREDAEDVTLFFSCKNLTRAKETQRGTLVIQVRTMITSSGEDWHILGRTEMEPIAANVEFTTGIDTEFVFESRQKMKVEVFEIGDYSNSGNVSPLSPFRPTPNTKSASAPDPRESTDGGAGLVRQNSLEDRPGIARTQSGVSGTKIGEVTFDLGDIAGALDNAKTLNLKNAVGQNVGSCNVKLEKSDYKEKSSYAFDVVALNIPKFHMFSKQNTYIKIYKQRIPDAKIKKMVEMDINPGKASQIEWILVHKTPPIDGPQIRFADVAISGERLCYNNRQIRMKFELWKAKKNNRDYILGSTTLCLDDITLKPGQTFPITLAQKCDTKTFIRFDSFRSERIYDFFDFVRGGISMSFVVGVDFTLSNKDHRDPASLHYFDGRNLNLYQKAILAVGEILEKYNHSRQIAAYGFGAKLTPNDPPNHFFPINRNYGNPFFKYFREMLEAYCSLLPTLTLSGPTNFGPLLRNVLDFADKKFQMDPYNYTVLLLLTDGAVTDLQETIDCIVAGSGVPLSVIIVGIGNENFEKMTMLDGNETPLVSSAGVKMSRDIVRFVSFNQLSNNPILLREEVLRELPGQVVDFYRAKKIPPCRPEESRAFRKGNSMGSTSDKDSDQNSFQSIENILEQGLMKAIGEMRE